MSIKTKLPKQKERFIYNKKHYKVQELLKNQNFWMRINELKKKFAKFDCPVPPKGFIGQGRFYIWWEKLGKAWGKAINSKRYKNAVQKITDGKKTWGSKEQGLIEQLEETHLPPVAYGGEFKKILDEFGFNPDNKTDMNWLDGLFFFNRRTYPHPITVIKLMRNKKSGELEVWVRFFGYTRIKDIPAKEIIKYQKYLPDYKGKNKPKKKKYTPRNKEVVDMYLSEKEKLQQSGRERNTQGKAIVTKIINKFKKKYPKLNKSTVDKIVRDWAE